MSQPSSIIALHPRDSSLTLKPLGFLDFFYDEKGEVWRFIKSTSRWREADYLVRAKGRRVLRIPGSSKLGPQPSRLILTAEVGPAPRDKPLCLHIDGNPANNAPVNLMWGDHAENMRHARMHAPERFALNEALVEEARELAMNDDVRGLFELVCRIDVHRSTLTHALSGHSWPYVDFPAVGRSKANEMARGVKALLRKHKCGVKGW